MFKDIPIQHQMISKVYQWIVFVAGLKWDIPKTRWSNRSAFKCRRWTLRRPLSPFRRQLPHQPVFQWSPQELPSLTSKSRSENKGVEKCVCGRSSAVVGSTWISSSSSSLDSSSASASHARNGFAFSRIFDAISLLTYFFDTLLPHSRNT